MAITKDNKAIAAIMEASGITQEQAKTCLYYAISTYFLPDELELMPILAIIGPQGTGKTDLLMQLRKLVNGPRLIGARTYPTLRDKFGITTTALLDDADDFSEKEAILKIEGMLGEFNDITRGLWCNYCLQRGWWVIANQYWQKIWQKELPSFKELRRVILELKQGNPCLPAGPRRPPH